MLELRHRPREITQLAGEGSNLQPPDPKSGVLPVELPAKGIVSSRTGRVIEIVGQVPESMSAQVNQAALAKRYCEAQAVLGESLKRA